MTLVSLDSPLGVIRVVRTVVLPLSVYPNNRTSSEPTRRKTPPFPAEFSFWELGTLPGKGDKLVGDELCPVLHSYCSAGHSMSLGSSASRWNLTIWILDL